jgi:hypothetical protein
MVNSSFPESTKLRKLAYIFLLVDLNEEITTKGTKVLHKGHKEI